jgi:hypothetical protein
MFRKEKSINYISSPISISLIIGNDTICVGKGENIVLHQNIISTVLLTFFCGWKHQHFYLITVVDNPEGIKV